MPEWHCELVHRGYLGRYVRAVRVGDLFKRGRLVCMHPVRRKQDVACGLKLRRSMRAVSCRVNSRDWRWRGDNMLSVRRWQVLGDSAFAVHHVRAWVVVVPWHLRVHTVWCGLLQRQWHQLLNSHPVRPVSAHMRVVRDWVGVQPWLGRV